ncbi:MAG: hypothetical protein J1E97_00700 [Muribaculaceae bacterium]|nr:hypothetical protein [Muribaculaceae bacterium]
MAMKQFNAEEMRKKIQEIKTEEGNHQNLDKASEINDTIQLFIEKMPEFVEEINKPMSDESFKTYAGVIGFIMRKGADVAADRFEKRLTELLKKANRNDKITLPTIAFYILMIVLIYLLLFFGGVVFGNFKAIHSDELSEWIFWIYFFLSVSIGIFLWLKRYFK